MTFRGITNDSLYILYNFGVYKCDQESLFVTIYSLLPVSCLHKLVYSINLTSQLPPMCLAKS